jgi:hypothetical protein
LSTKYTVEADAGALSRIPTPVDALTSAPTAAAHPAPTKDLRPYAARTVQRCRIAISHFSRVGRYLVIDAADRSHAAARAGQG